MARKSKIEWTNDSWNPVTGCTKVSPGCKNCYAEAFAERFRGVPGHPYEQGFDLKLWPERLSLPLKWKKPRRIFVNSMSDLFHEGIQDEFIDRVFHTMACAPRHTFQILTKRADRMEKYARGILEDGERLRGVVAPAMMTSDPKLAWPLKNVWLGVSVETQQFASERIPALCATPAAVRFLSCEPLLGELDLLPDLCGCDQCGGSAEAMLEPRRIDWVIVGGESGHGARPLEVRWVQDILHACREGGVAAFVKQLGACWAKEHAAKNKKGGDPAEWPEGLRVRQFPG